MKTLVLAMGCTSVGCEIYLYSYVSMYMYAYVCVTYIYIYLIHLLYLINNQLGEMKTLVLAKGCTSVGCAHI